MSFRTRIILAPLASLLGVVALLVIPFMSMGDLQDLAQEVSLAAERRALVDDAEREMLSRAEKAFRSMAIGDVDSADGASGRWENSRQYRNADRRIYPGSDGWAQYFDPDIELERLWKNFEKAAAQTLMTAEGASELHSARSELGARLSFLRDAMSSQQRHALHATRHTEGTVFAVVVLGIGFFMAIFILVAFCVRGATVRLGCAISDISEISSELSALSHQVGSAGGKGADIPPGSLAPLAAALNGANEDLVDLMVGRRWRRPTDDFGQPLPPGGSVHSFDDDFPDF